MIFPDLENPSKPRKPLTPEQKKVKNFGRRLDLFTVGNPKTIKGMKKGFMPMVLMLMPAYLSGREICPFRSPGCTRACLNTAGRGGMIKGGAKDFEEVIDKSNVIQEARKRRTNMLFADTPSTVFKEDTPKVPAAFADALLGDIQKLIEFCRQEGYTPCVRLNGTSDLRWEMMPIEGRTVFQRFPGIQFYDYTKQPLRQRKKIPSNYYLNYSFTEQAISSRRMREYLQIGVNPVVVFSTKKGKPLPATFAGMDVIDGDVTDLRFLDPPGVVVGLRAKGFAQDDHTGFVIKVGKDQENPREMTFEGDDLFPDIQ